MDGLVHESTLSGVQMIYGAGISDLEVRAAGSEVYLYSASRAGGGMSVFRLAPGQDAELIDEHSLSARSAVLGGPVRLSVLDVAEQTLLVPTGRLDQALPALQLGPQGGVSGVSALDDASGFSGDVMNMLILDLPDGPMLYAAIRGQAGPSGFRVGGDLSLSPGPAAEVSG
ncbi:MAG: hypothetical protein WCD16_12045, partial [Paracoccaceae bacterium]